MKNLLLEAIIKMNVKFLEDKVASIPFPFPPTIDDLGRAHAPINGYVVEGVVYSKGEFIPMGNDSKIDEVWNLRIGRKETMNRVKVRVDNELNEAIEFINKKVPHVTLSLGSSWNDGTEAYLYVKSVRKSYQSLICKKVKELQNVVEVQRGRVLLEEGRLEVWGQLIKVEVVPCAFNGAKATACFKTPEGAFLYGNLPSFAYQDDIGKMFHFRATISVSNSEKYNTFKRPFLIKEK